MVVDPSVCVGGFLGECEEGGRGWGNLPLVAQREG